MPGRRALRGGAGGGRHGGAGGECVGRRRIRRPLRARRPVRGRLVPARLHRRGPAAARSRVPGRGPGARVAGGAAARDRRAGGGAGRGAAGLRLHLPGRRRRARRRRLPADRRRRHHRRRRTRRRRAPLDHLAAARGVRQRDLLRHHGGGRRRHGVHPARAGRRPRPGARAGPFHRRAGAPDPGLHRPHRPHAQCAAHPGLAGGHRARGRAALRHPGRLPRLRRVNRRTDDDKTLVLATRAEPPP